MPHFWNNILVVTKEELVPAHYTAAALKKELTRYDSKPYGIKRAQKGGNGRQLLIEFDSLTKEIQNALGDPRKLDHVLERYYSIDPLAVDFYHNWQYPNGNYLPPHTQEQYITNSSVLGAAQRLFTARVNERKAKGGSTRGLLSSICEDVKTFNPVLKAKFQTTHNLPSTYRHFKASYDAFTSQEGYESVIKDKKGTQATKALKLDEPTQDLLNNMFGTLSKKPTPTEVAVDYQAFLSGSITVVNQLTGEIYEPSQFPELSESTIRTYLTSWKSTAGTHIKRNGNRQQLIQKFEPPHSFKTPTFAGSILSVDDRQPPFEYEKGKRMWFYNGIDLASGMFTCFVWGKSKEGIILEFYRQLVRNYHDWGVNLPFELEAESSLNSSFTDTFLQDGRMFGKVNIYANKARSKRIEGYFRPLRYQLEKNREGWLARPFAKSEPNQVGNTQKIVVPYDRLVQESLKDLETWNNMPSVQDPSVTRYEYFIQNQNPDLKPTNYKAILPHLGFKTDTSCNAGIIRLQSREWLLGDKGTIATGEDLIRLMSLVEGKDVEVFWLDDNQGKPFKALVYQNGRYLCEAITKPVYNKSSLEQTEVDRQARDLMTRYAATVQTYMKTQKNKLEPITIIDSRKKTLNNNFKIPMLNRFETTDELVEVLDDLPTEQEPAAVGQSWNSKFKL